MTDFDWYGMALFLCLLLALLALLAGFRWMLRVNAEDLRQLERELMESLHQP